MQYEDFKRLATAKLDQALDNRFVGSLGAKAPKFFTIEKGKPQLFAMMMGTQLLVAGGNQEKQIKSLIEQLNNAKIELKSIFAAEKHCEAFLKAYTKPAKLSTAFYILHLRKVIMPIRFPKGKLRQAEEGELDLAIAWVTAFFAEVLPQNRPQTVLEKQAKTLLERGALYFWDDQGEIQSMAAIIRHLPKGKAISHVYTPPKFRGMGLASASVAMLSQKMLEQGAEFCCLFTDQQNPISNKIYERIGYQQIGGFMEYVFLQSDR
jgi:predicted GNAT family acetyltransferase